MVNMTAFMEGNTERPVDGAPQMSGKRFLLLILLPALLSFAVLFLMYAPKKPLGGPISGLPEPLGKVEAVPAE